MPTITTGGAVPFTPTELLARELEIATDLAPGLTANLPGSLVEDMASTATGALVVIDQAVTDLVNSISPYVSNPTLLYQLGAVYGVQQGVGSNTSVYVTFVSPDVGFVIAAGLVVSDGTHQFIVQTSAVIESGGQSEPLFCVAIESGSFAVPIGTVTQIISSIPSSITMSCINQVSGVAGDIAETVDEYRLRVIQAGQATAQGVPQFLKTQLQKINGVLPHLVSIRQSGVNWIVICGGGDPYAVAHAIYMGMSDIGVLIGSTLVVVSITNAYSPVVTTNLNHNYATGQIVTFAGALGMSGINGIPFVARVTAQKTFELNVAISTITWSAGTVTVVTANPHGLAAGTTAGQIYNVLPVAYNGAFTLTQVDATTFTYPLASDPGVSTRLGYTPITTVTSGSYTGNSAKLTPVLRNVLVDITEPPDVYQIPFVNPPSQIVTVNLAWDTIYTNFVSAAAVDNLATPALVTYVNNISVGQPINVFDMQDVFKNAIVTLIPPNLISKMIFSVTINGIVTAPDVDTGVIYGDPESYFLTDTSKITITQG